MAAFVISSNPCVQLFPEIGYRKGKFSCFLAKVEVNYFKFYVAKFTFSLHTATKNGLGMRKSLVELFGSGIFITIECVSYQNLDKTQSAIYKNQLLLLS